MEKLDPRDQPAASPLGVGRDLARLRSESAATAAELREFLGQMRGKRPQDVLGLVAGSGLARAMLIATLGCVVLMAALTVIPYFLYHRGAPPAAQPAAKTVPAKAAAKTAPAETTAEKAPAAEPAAPAGTAAARAEPARNDPAAKGVKAPAPGAAGSPEHVQRAIKAMDMDETKLADPKKNPMEKSLDKLLDKIE